MEAFFKTNGSSSTIFVNYLIYSLNDTYIQEILELKNLILVSKGVQNLKIPVTAKIRVFDDINKSVEYAKMIERYINKKLLHFFIIFLLILTFK